MILHSTQKGTGTALVLLHGFCESSFIWDDFVMALSPVYQVITLDLPGFGKSAPFPHETANLAEYAEDVHETLQSLGIQKCVMIGHSLGGYVALAYARKYADTLLGLGLFHSTAFADDEVKKNTRTKSIDFIQTHGAAVFVQNMFGNLFAASSKKKLQKEIASFIKKCAKTSPESIIKTQLAMRDRADSTAILAKLSVPVLFIVGKEDQSVPLEKSLAQCHIPKESIVHILEEVAHMGMIEAKYQTVKAVANFMAYCE